MNNPTINIPACISTEELQEIQTAFPEYNITYLVDLFNQLEGGTK